jgi:hypothetical protein
MLSMIANPVTALPVGYPRSGLSRSDLVLWHFASLHGNAAFWSLSDRSGHPTSGQKWQDRSRMTRSRHRPDRNPAVQRLPPLCYRFGPPPVVPISVAAAWQPNG